MTDTNDETVGSLKGGVANRETDLANYRGLWDTDIDIHFEMFKTRWVNEDTADADKITKEKVPFENELKKAGKAFLSIIPASEIEITATDKEGLEDERVNTILQDWLKGAHCGNTEKFKEYLSTIIMKCFRDGEFPAKVTKKAGMPIVTEIDDINFDILSDLDNVNEITGYVAKYNLTIETGQDATSTVEVTETITRDGNVFAVGGITDPESTWSHGLSEFTLINFKYEDVQNEKHGRSGLSDAIEAQLILSTYLCQEMQANKLGAFSVIFQQNAEDGSDSTRTEMSLDGGSYIPWPVGSLNLNGAPQSVIDKVESAKDGVWESIGVRRSTKEAISNSPNSSGKSLVILNASGKRNVRRFMTRIESSTAQLMKLVLSLIDNGKPDDYNINVVFPSLDTEDPTVQLKRAEFLAGQGFIEEALKAIGFDDDKIVAMIEAQENERESANQELFDSVKAEYEKSKNDDNDDESESE